MSRHEALGGGEIKLETMFGLDAVINPEGAFVESLRAGGRDLILPRQEIEGKNRGGIPICAPVFGPAEILGLNQHGFARDLPWDVKHAEGTGAILTLDIDEGKCDEFGLPEEYLGCSMEAIFMLASISNSTHSMNINLKVKNQNPKTSIVVAPGIHPYFPVSEKQGADGVVIDSRSTSRTFNDLDLEKSVKIPDPTGKISFDLRNENDANTSVEIMSEDLMKYVIWSANPDKYICVEPTQAGPVGIERTKEDLYSLYGIEPHEAKNYAVKITWRS